MMGLVHCLEKVKMIPKSLYHCLVYYSTSMTDNTVYCLSIVEDSCPPFISGLSFFKPFRLALGPTQSCLCSILGSLYLEVKWP